VIGLASVTTGAQHRLRAPFRRVVARFAEVACPPQVRTARRVEPLLGEFELFLGVLPPPARRAVIAAFLTLDAGARLYPRSRGRRFLRVDDQVADAYLRALLARRGGLGGAVKWIKGLVVMCYYELPDVQEEIGYRPDPYIAAVSRRRLASYGAEIRAGEAAVLAPSPPAPGPPAPRPPAREGSGPPQGSGPRGPREAS
jgi:hypothetical protein